MRIRQGDQPTGPRSLLPLEAPDQHHAAGGAGPNTTAGRDIMAADPDPAADEAEEAVPSDPAAEEPAEGEEEEDPAPAFGPVHHTAEWLAGGHMAMSWAGHQM